MKCWTCGHKVETLSFKCPACKNLTEMKKLTEIVSAKAANEAVRHGDLERELQHYFTKLSSTVSAGLSNIAHAVEWGFRGLSWRVEQQTEVLRSIDETLKTPKKTEANEYRQQAEEAERFGDLPNAQERYERALDSNITDYRIYVGLAETLIQQAKFVEAQQILQRSLHYAPKGEIDYKSYSLRLTGHIHACEENYAAAAATLHQATELSPSYADAHYDYAQYCAQTGDTRHCLESLTQAVDMKPLYWSLAFREQNFDPARTLVDEMLWRVGTEAARPACESFDELASIFQDVNRTCAFMDQEKLSRDYWHLDVKNLNAQMAALRELRNGDDLYSFKELERLVPKTAEKLRDETKSGPLKAMKFTAQELQEKTKTLKTDLSDSRTGLLVWVGFSLLPFLLVWWYWGKELAVALLVLLFAASYGVYAFYRKITVKKLDEVNAKSREFSTKVIKPLETALKRMDTLSPPVETKMDQIVWTPAFPKRRRY
jgi:tetratricopeptide (TPR) repeat protein